MAELISKEKYRGSIANLVYTGYNEKTYVRKKRGKMTKREKQKPSWRGTVIQNGRFALATELARILRRYVPPYSSYSHLHSRLSGKLSEIIQMDHVHDRGDFTLMAEHFHRIGETKTNDALPERVMEQLHAGVVVVEGDKILVDVPRLSLRQLKDRPDAVEVWVNAAVIRIGAKPVEVWQASAMSGKVPVKKHGAVRLELPAPEMEGSDVCALMIGFSSFDNGNRMKDAGMNGFVYKALQMCNEG